MSRHATSQNTVGEEPEPGVLYLVPTPLGHLGDLSPRAAHILGHVDKLAAEDTRVTRKLLARLDVHPELVSCHEHNEEGRASQICGWLADGLRVGLVSDAGTPLVSDPGYRVVQAVLADGHRVCALPGPVAATTALSVSGLPPDRFTFVGFLPKKPKSKADALLELQALPWTMVFYSACHELLRDLAAIEHHLGDRQVCASRDLTKRGERHWRGTASVVQAELRTLERISGEWTVVVEGAAPAPVQEGVDDAADALIGALLAAGLGARAVRDVVADHTGLGRKLVYDRVLERNRD